MKEGSQTLKQLFNMEVSDHLDLFARSPYPWVWIGSLCEYLAKMDQDVWQTRDREGVTIDRSQGPVWIEPSAVIRPGAAIYGPAFIGHGTFVNHGALIRGGCIIMEGCSIGHCVEIKHSILLPGATCGHRNYVGDSVLGRNVNMGDGSGIANIRADLDSAKTIKVTWGGERIDTGLTKFGALVGDGSSLGCRSTLNPGTILGKECLVMPNTAVKGTHAPRTLLSSDAELIAKPR